MVIILLTFPNLSSGGCVITCPECLDSCNNQTTNYVCKIILFISTGTVRNDIIFA